MLLQPLNTRQVDVPIHALTLFLISIITSCTASKDAPPESTPVAPVDCTEIELPTGSIEVSDHIVSDYYAENSTFIMDLYPAILDSGQNAVVFHQIGNYQEGHMTGKIFIIPMEIGVSQSIFINARTRFYETELSDFGITMDIADLNGDGSSDLVATSRFSSQIYLLPLSQTQEEIYVPDNSIKLNFQPDGLGGIPSLKAAQSGEDPVLLVSYDNIYRIDHPYQSGDVDTLATTTIMSDKFYLSGSMLMIDLTGDGLEDILFKGYIQSDVSKLIDNFSLIGDRVNGSPPGVQRCQPLFQNPSVNVSSLPTIITKERWLNLPNASLWVLPVLIGG